jgi:N-acetylmuramic acid 6-phosphate etherase
MSTPDFRDPRLTEQRNPRTEAIDVASSLDIVDLMSAEDRRVPEAVHACRAEIARTVDLAVEAFRGGGRLMYVGAGTSGRLGVLDATECPPTFGTPPDMVVGIIAGGLPALTRSQEGAEDDVAAAVHDLDAHGVSARDVVLGIAASGTTPYVRAALGRAKRLGAKTALLTCSDPPPDLAAACDVTMAVRAGPEVLTGSTRLKAGTATKLVLNMLTTAAMVRIGKTYGNLMVDVQTGSEKLKDRARRIVNIVTGLEYDEADKLLKVAQWNVKAAIVMQKTGLTYVKAIARLRKAHDSMREALGEDIEPRLRGLLQGHAEGTAVTTVENSAAGPIAPAKRPRS